jgi:hypothetical protein
VNSRESGVRLTNSPSSRSMRSPRHEPIQSPFLYVHVKSVVVSHVTVPPGWLSPISTW